jgi:hypothetical protein
MLKSQTVFSRLFWVAPLLLFCATATAQDKTVFGMRLGEVLSIPECATDKYLRYSPVAKGAGTCYKRFLVDRVPEKKEYDEKYIKKYREEHPRRPLGTETVTIEISDAPLWLVDNGVTACLIDARLEGIRFNTLGIANAELMLLRLKEKYGEPSEIVKLNAQNRVGASFPAFIATWVSPDSHVTFNSVDGSLDRGSVIIETKKGNSLRMEELKNSLKDKNPL